MFKLSAGFCKDALVEPLSNSSNGSSVTLRWPQPSLQVIDIQRFPEKVLRSSDRSLFYLALSDTLSLIWLVIPPATEMEELVSRFQIEVGYCLRLWDYILAPARNGRNVVVPVSMSYSDNACPLLGSPSFDPSLFRLSAKALVRQHSGEGGVPLKVTPLGDCDTRSIQEVVAEQGKRLKDCVVYVRVVWKSKIRSITSGGTTTQRFAVDCVVVDADGHAIAATFFGSSTTSSFFDVNDCVVCRNPSFATRGKSSHNERMNVYDWSLLPACSTMVSTLIPTHPSLMFNACPVQQVIEQCELGDVVSVYGDVISLSPVTQANTRYGHVGRSSVCLRDPTSTIHTIDVTLWGDFSLNVKPCGGERWCFSNVVVGTFGGKLNLSTKCGSAAFAMHPKCQPVTPSDVDCRELYPLSSQAAVSDSSGGSDVVQIVFDLDEASPTLPVMAKITSVRLPLTYMACSACGRKAPGVATSCASCPGAPLEDRFLVQLEFSDGLQATRAVGFEPVGKELFGIDTQALLKRRKELPNFERMLTHAVVGFPALFWLDHSIGDIAHVRRCQRVDMARCTVVLLSAVEQLMEGGAL